MRVSIGINIHNSDESYDNDNIITAVSLAHLFKLSNIDVSIITFKNHESLRTLLKEFTDGLSILDVENQLIENTEKGILDILIDIGGYITPSLRSQLANKCTVIIPGSPLLSEIEKVTYIGNYYKRSFEGVSEIWIWQEWSTTGEDQILSVLHKKPVRKVPFVWSQFASSNSLRNKLKGVSITPQFNKNEPADIIILEKDTSQLSSTILPIITTGLLMNRKNIKINSFQIMNQNNLSNHPYMKDNILSSFSSLPVSQQPVWIKYVQPCCWDMTQNIIVLGNCRFTPLQLYMLDLLWLGIPLVHNSILLRDLHPVLKNTYYSGNNSTEMAICVENYKNISRSELAEIHVAITHKFGISKEKAMEWSTILDNIITKTDIIEIPKNVLQLIEDSDKNIKKKIIRIGFAHQWEGFNPTNNFFIDLLNHYYGKEYTIEGIEYIGDKSIDSSLNLFIYGPFYNNNEKHIDFPKNVPRIFFTGENCQDNEYKNYPDLCLTFSTKEDEKHIRFPLWMLYIEWFDNDTIIPQRELNSNPNKLPNFLCTNHTSVEDYIEFENRVDYCSFIVSNPNCEIRNKIFHALNEYKKVNSGGLLFNNIGGYLQSTYAGGGAGDIAKYNFMSLHKFSLCFENSIGDGYVTEKLLHAKLAGCVPLYYGDKFAEHDFNPDGFFNLHKMFGNDTDAMIDFIKNLDSDDNKEKCKIISNTPALSGIWLERAWDRLEKVAKALFSLSSKSHDNSIEQKQLHLEKEITIPSPIFVSFITSEFEDSIRSNIESLHGIKKAFVPKLRYIIYTRDDVSEDIDIANKLVSSYDWIELRTVPSSKGGPDDFPDFWTPGYFGWKLWILKDLAFDQSLQNMLIVYTDAGALWTKFVDKLFYNGYKNDIACFYDPEQYNYQWCNKYLINALSPPREHLQKNQILAGFIAFRAGSFAAKNIFEKAYILGCNKQILCGDNTAPYLGDDGKIYGNRHDQSILGLLFLQNNITMLNAQLYIDETSMRSTIFSNKAIYLHRRRFASHRTAFGLIDDIWMINLNRRKDRWETWIKEYPYIASKVKRFPAIDGKNLVMDDSLCSIFPITDHNWKKSVMGCALSHLILWLQLVCESPAVKNYCILEDDMRFIGDWNISFDKIIKAMEYAPEDADVLYLGGVLPLNLPILQEVLEPVNSFWSKVIPNTFFVQKDAPPQAVMHLCTYGYIITKKGAAKLLNGLHKTEMGCYTSIDHYMWLPNLNMNNYIITPLAAKCFQDSDEQYINSDFNNFDRVDTFDSDIWNNKDCFERDIIEPFYETSNDPSWKALLKFATKSLIQNKQEVSIASIRLLSEDHCLAGGLTNIVDLSENNSSLSENNSDNIDNYTLTSAITSVTNKSSFLIDENKLYIIYLYDLKNITTPFLKLLYNDIEYILFDEIFIHNLMNKNKDKTNIWFIVTSNTVNEWNIIFKNMNRKKIPFYVIHDEDYKNEHNISFYNLEYCKSVARFYQRSDVDTIFKDKVYTLPLGPFSPNNSDIIPFENKELVWSFHGSSWYKRPLQLDYLSSIKSNECVLINTWDEHRRLSQKEYSNVLNSTKFIPILRGHHFDTFRLYEAIEHGCIPLYIRNTNDDDYWKWLSQHLSLLNIPSWESATNTINYFIKNPDKANLYIQGLTNQWNTWKNEICAKLTPPKNSNTR
jgi:GR25 family glycosyltransferase involved in LPS biosynthesis